MEVGSSAKRGADMPLKRRIRAGHVGSAALEPTYDIWTAMLRN